MVGRQCPQIPTNPQAQQPPFDMLRLDKKRTTFKKNGSLSKRKKQTFSRLLNINSHINEMSLLKRAIVLVNKQYIKKRDHPLQIASSVGVFVSLS